MSAQARRVHKLKVAIALYGRDLALLFHDDAATLARLTKHYRDLVTELRKDLKTKERLRGKRG